MNRTRDVIFAAMIIFSAFNSALISGLRRSFTVRDFRPKSYKRQTNFLGRKVGSFGSPEVEMSRTFDLTLRASSLSHDEVLSINGTESSPQKSFSDRRILQLIPKVHERLLNEEYSGTLWDAICYEASAISESDHKAATLMSNFILSQPSFESAVIDFVSNQLETPLVQATSIRNLFAEICKKNPELSSVWALDLMASAMRDNSQPNAVSVLLFNKGFHSLVTYRIANALWLEGRDSIAIYFQSLTSRTFGADIHPACKIGHSCSLSGATGVVIGETAVIGNYCSISHDVTLGGNGKQKGDRHPKVGNGVFLSAGSIVMGNIIVGDGAIINAGSVVTKPVREHTRVGGVPGREIAEFSVDPTIVTDVAQRFKDERRPDFPKSFTDLRVK